MSASPPAPPQAPSPRAAPTLRSLAAGALSWGAASSDRALAARWTAAEGWGAPVVAPLADIAGLSPLSAGLHYGCSVFEGMKCFAAADKGGDGGADAAAAPGANAALFRPWFHARRFNASARRMALPEVDDAELLRGVARLVRMERDAGWLPAGRGAALYVRPLLVASEPALGVRRSTEAMLFVTLHPVGSYFGGGPQEASEHDGEGDDELVPSSLRLRVDPQVRMRAWPGGVGSTKTSGNYASSILPAEEAASAGYDQVLWTGPAPAREVGEVGQMNVCWVETSAAVGGTRRILVTPALDGTILPGCTRDSVLELAASTRIVDAVEERTVPLADLVRGIESGVVVEMFGTGTGAIIAPVKSVSVADEHGVFREHVIKEKEEAGDVGPTLRRMLLDICHQKEPSKWTVDIDTLA